MKEKFEQENLTKEKFELENLISLKDAHISSTVSIFAIVTDVGTHGNDDINHTFYILKIIDQSLLEFNSNNSDKLRVESYIMFRKSADSKFQYPDLIQVGDIIMIKRGNITKVSKEDKEYILKLKIKLFMSDKLSFGYWLFDCSSKSDYNAYSFETNKEFTKYKLSDYDKSKIYELRKLAYTHYSKENSLIFIPEYNLKIIEFGSFDLTYFDLYVRIKSKKVISSNKIIFEIEDDRNDKYIILLIGSR